MMKFVWDACCMNKVSRSFAEAASRKEEGKTTFDVKLCDLEQHLKKAEKQQFDYHYPHHWPYPYYMPPMPPSHPPNSHTPDPRA